MVATDISLETQPEKNSNVGFMAVISFSKWRPGNKNSRWFYGAQSRCCRRFQTRPRPTETSRRVVSTTQTERSGTSSTDRWMVSRRFDSGNRDVVVGVVCWVGSHHGDAFSHHLGQEGLAEMSRVNFVGLLVTRGRAARRGRSCESPCRKLMLVDYSCSVVLCDGNLLLLWLFFFSVVFRAEFPNLTK